VLRQLPAASIATPLESQPGLAVLLPFSGNTEAQKLTGQLLAGIPGLRCHHCLTLEPATAEFLWKELQTIPQSS
jgi:hypothetical protein